MYSHTVVRGTHCRDCEEVDPTGVCLAQLADALPDALARPALVARMARIRALVAA